MNLIEQLEQEEIARLGKVIPLFSPGDTVVVPRSSAAIEEEPGIGMAEISDASSLSWPWPGGRCSWPASSRPSS